MQRSLHVLLALVLLLVLGCSTTNDVVGRGPFQKRKYRPGWNIDLAGSQRSNDQRGSASERTAAMERIPMRSVQDRTGPEVSASVAIREPIAATGASASLTTGRRSRDITSPHRIAKGQARNAMGEGPGPLPQETDGATGTPRVNRMAMVSGVFLAVSLFVFALSGTIPLFTYLMVFTFITGVIGLLLAIKHRDMGKGIAIAAILVSIGFLIASLSGADLP